MWNLTPDYVQQVREELRGRRAAIQARHAEELKSLETDLEEIETLERVAYAVAAKHALEAEPAPEVADDEPRLAELEAEPNATPSEPAQGAAAKGLSRWRMRVDANSETE